MRVIVTGSRNWEGVWAEGIIQMTLTKVQELADMLGSPLIIKHGDCPTGADQIADRWARRRDISVLPFPASWQLGKMAGPIRNQDMAISGADMVLAFVRDRSRGTMNMVQMAEKYRIPVYVTEWRED